MIIYHASVCLNFEIRHQWQVSSILEQTGPDMPEIILDVGTLAGDDNPLRFPAELAKSPVSLRYYPTKRETFAKRGLVRNEQVTRAIKAGADWVFFADCDRLYHPRFFSELARILRTDKKIANCGKILTGIFRAEATANEATALVMAGAHEGFYHPNAFIRAVPLAYQWQHKPFYAAGGMQIVKTSVLRDKLGGTYVPDNHSPDKHLFLDGQKARSDMKFRMRLGQLATGLPMCIHLGHRRDKEVGYHLEEQR